MRSAWRSPIRAATWTRSTRFARQWRWRRNARICTTTSAACGYGGQEREAAVSLKAALAGLEPGNESARENLRALLLRTQGQQPTLRAEANARPVLPIKAAAGPVLAPAAAPAKTVAAPAIAALQVVSVPTAPAMTTRSEDVPRERIVPAAAAVPGPVEQQRASPGDAPGEAAQPLKPFRLEISNGDGITGFALLVRGWLGQQGWTTQRLTNERPYQRVRTVVQYRAGHEEAAYLISRPCRCPPVSNACQPQACAVMSA